ncbi:hypothetical protein J1N35_015665 [Gossypium stocksii]|uniref:RNase H type-1 domain-containing protein n=1 Tax=Gossypium stocksii TaxID=47602 RepID=A0A9D3VYP1_9ROSI|nr:hypothetical protein J1N35_015665 [Gossypium stocksii]
MASVTNFIEDCINLILFTIWALWMGRNRSYHEGLPQSASNVVTFIRLYIRELSFLGEALCGGSGGAMAASGWAFCEKALAFFRVVCFAADLEFTHVTIEANSLAVVKKANSLHDDRSEIAVLIKEGTYRLRNCFIDTIVQHCFRQGNRVAHHLAAIGVGQSLHQFWVEEVPLSVEPTVAADRWWVDLPD